MADPQKQIPATGIDHDTLLAQMRQMRDGDVDWRGNKVWSLVYHHSDEHTTFLEEAHKMFFDTNGLNPMAFRSLKNFETDVVRMTANLLHGDQNVVGTMTSGGTESIILAVHTYRDHARAHKPHVRVPEIIVPDSVHVAFDKAGQYLDVKIVHAPLTADLTADVNAMERLINDNTIALVASAPSYPHGILDPVEAIAALAQRHGLGCHVDACIGGFFLPFLDKLEGKLPPFDYRVPGVTSISADVHKYGYAAKGASTITYRGIEYLRHQFFVTVDWPGGIFISPTLPGTRPGGSIAAAWAALHAIGEAGYLENVKNVMAVTRTLQNGINAIPSLNVAGAPAMSVFAFTTTDPDLNIYAVGDVMEQRGWHIDRQQKPASLHLMVNPGHALVADQFLQDLREAVDHVKSHPETALSGSAPTYGLMFKTPVRGIIKHNVLEMVMAMYSADAKLPELGPGVEGQPPQGIPAPLFFLMKTWYHLRRLFRK